MEINAKEARAKLSSLLKEVEKGGEVILLRRGKKVARLIPIQNRPGGLPNLKAFRASIRIKGGPLSDAVKKGREKERY
jgi:prevent-host-death family protein